MSDDVRQFYDQLAADYHLIFADWQASVRYQGEVLARLIGKASGGKAHTVLDCACGIGTQTLGLAMHGYQVHATDLSPVAVTRAAQEAQALDVSITTGVADFRTLATQVAGTFDVALAADNALPHLLIEADMLRAATNIRAKVTPGGLFLASIRDYDLLSTERHATPVSVIDDDTGRRILFQIWDWDADGKVYTLRHFILTQADGGWRTVERVTRYRAWKRDELNPLFEQAGFTSIEWLMPEQSGFYQPIVIAHKEGQ